MGRRAATHLEAVGAPPETIRAILNHASGAGVTQLYPRSDPAPAERLGMLDDKADRETGRSRNSLPAVFPRAILCRNVLRFSILRTYEGRSNPVSFRLVSGRLGPKLGPPLSCLTNPVTVERRFRPFSADPPFDFHR
jgi:hypothetical protein